MTSYTWNEENRLTGIVYPTGQIETSTYAANGQRRSRQTSSGTTLFVQDGQNLLQEMDVSLVLQAQYTDFPGVWGGLTSMRRGSLSSFYVMNPHKSTALLLDGSGSVTDSYYYKFYGEFYAGSGSTVNPFQWNGQYGYYQDQTDRYFVRARHYRTDFMRWISRDPLGVWNSDWNLYRYANNEPGNVLDPSGLGWWDWICPPKKKKKKKKTTLPQVCGGAYDSDDPDGNGEVDCMACNSYYFNECMSDTHWYDYGAIDACYARSRSCSAFCGDGNAVSDAANGPNIQNCWSAKLPK